jgi:hypothetical protein
VNRTSIRANSASIRANSASIRANSTSNRAISTSNRAISASNRAIGISVTAPKAVPAVGSDTHSPMLSQTALRFENGVLPSAKLPLGYTGGCLKPRCGLRMEFCLRQNSRLDTRGAVSNRVAV